MQQTVKNKQHPRSNTKLYIITLHL